MSATIALLPESGATQRPAVDGGLVAAVAEDEVYRLLDSSPRGVSAAAARERLDRVGRNALTAPPHPSLALRFLAQFTDLFAVVLLAAAGVTFLAYVLSRPRDVGSFQLGVAILAVVVLNAVIGFLQEYSAERTVASLQAMVPQVCRVMRDGQRQEIAVSDVVPGDVLVLEAGDAVSADCRFVDVHTMSVDNAALTGESAPVVGAGRLGTQFTAVLTSAGNEVTLVDQDPVRLEPPAEIGVTRTVVGDEHSPAAGNRLDQIAIPTGCVVAAVIRDGQPTVPAPTFTLLAGDELIIVAQTATVEDINRAFQ